MTAPRGGYPAGADLAESGVVPAGISIVTRSSMGVLRLASTISLARTAYPSMLELGNGGRLRSARMSSASTRLNAPASVTVSAGRVRTLLRMFFSALSTFSNSVNFVVCRLFTVWFGIGLYTFYMVISYT